MSAGSRKVIITCAVTGSGHTPTMSASLPYTVDDVVGQSVAAVEAGAAIIHLHARDPRDGRPTADPAVFLDYLKGIKDSTDAVVSIDLNSLVDCHCSGCDETFSPRLARDMAAAELARWEAVVRWVDLAADVMTLAD